MNIDKKIIMDNATVCKDKGKACICELIGYTNRLVKESDWKLLAVVKACSGLFGLLLGMSVCDKIKKPFKKIVKITFIVAYVAAMIYFVKKVMDYKKEDNVENC